MLLSMQLIAVDGVDQTLGLFFISTHEGLFRPDKLGQTFMLGTISVFQEHSSQFRFCFCLHRTRQLSEAGIGVDAISC
jgi:hypothetical protein